MAKLDIKRLNREGRELWNRKAQFWDELHGDFGNSFHRRLIEPTVLQLLDLRADEAVLDIGCGNGALARRLAEQARASHRLRFQRRTDSAGGKARRRANSPAV